MSNTTKNDIIIGTKLALAISMRNGTPVRTGVPKPTAKKSKMSGKLEEPEQPPRRRYQRAPAETKSQPPQLITEVTRMNEAPAEIKTELIAAVVTHMVKQHAAMHLRMEKLHDEIMSLVQSGRQAVP